MRALGVLAAGAVLWGLAGCREERAAPAWMPPLLTNADIELYLRAEKRLGAGGKHLEELRSFFGVDQREVSIALAGAGFTPERFLEMAEAIFLARQGKRMFVELPERRRALAAALAKEDWSGPQAAAIKAALRKEARSEAERTPFIERVLRNAAALEAYEARLRERSAGAGEKAPAPAR